MARAILLELGMFSDWAHCQVPWEFVSDCILSCYKPENEIAMRGVSSTFGAEHVLIQLLDYLSVASPESGLFSDWSRNKRYLELSH